MHSPTGGDGWYWPAREMWFVQRTPEDAVVLDLGAGAMHLNKSLVKHEKRAIYVPSDGVDRGEPSMRVCNYRYMQLPVCVEPTPTVVVMQGVLEYQFDKVSFLRAFRCAYRDATILLSSYVAERPNDLRTTLTFNQFNEIFTLLDLKVTNSSACALPLTRPHCWELKPLPLTRPKLTCRINSD